jgi:hypothetical protein
VRVPKLFIISPDHLRMVKGHTLLVGTERIAMGKTCRDEFFKLIRGKGQARAATPG